MPSITKVWPALWPPWNRTTISACSESQSTILPLPSSPHWDPTTTTFAIDDSSCASARTLTPGYAGQVHLRIKEAGGGGKAQNAARVVPHGVPKELILNRNS